MLIGLVGAVALSLAVVLAVALPQLRQGSRILTPEGERLTQEAREKVTRGGRRAASGTADLVAGSLGRIASTLKGGPSSAGSRHAVQRGAHRDDPDPAIGRAAAPGTPADGDPATIGPQAPEDQDLVIDLRTPAEEPPANPEAHLDGDAARPEPNGSEPHERRVVGTTPESELGLSKGRHAR